MTRLRQVLLAAIAAVGIGFAGAAAAQNLHVMNVAVPGGGIAQVHYVGDVPPRIVFLPPASGFDAWTPIASISDAWAPFAMLDRIAAEMDRRAAAMLRQAEALAAGAWPADGQSYSHVSTVPGAGMCMRGVRITARGDGSPPRVERYSAGDCGAATVPQGGSTLQPAAPVPAAPPRQPDLILTQNSGPSPYVGMVRQVAAAR